MPRGHELAPVIMWAFRTNFSLFSRKKIVMGKKDRCAVFRCNIGRLFPKKYSLKFSFCPKSARKY